MRRFIGCLSLAAALLPVGATAARAQFAVCNQTLDVVNVAVGQEREARFETEGWWTIAANQCVDVIKVPLDSRYIYVYATDVFRRPVLEGSIEMCVGERRFEIVGIDECWTRGFAAARFLEVDTEAVERWTLFLRGADPS